MERTLAAGQCPFFAFRYIASQMVASHGRVKACHRVSNPEQCRAEGMLNVAGWAVGCAPTNHRLPRGRIDDEVFYAEVAGELERDRRKGLWTKALVDAGGDEGATRLVYIELRKEQLMAPARAKEKARRAAATAKEKARLAAASNKASRDIGLTLLVVLVLFLLGMLLLGVLVS